LNTVSDCVYWTLHDNSHFEIPSNDGPPKAKEKVFHKSDIFSTPSIMKSGKNMNLQTSPKLKMKVGVWDLINLHMPHSWAFLTNNILKLLALSRAFEPKEPNLNKSSVLGFSIIIPTFYHVKILTIVQKLHITICKMTSFSAKGHKTCENDFWDQEFAQIRAMPVVLFVFELVHQIEGCMSKEDKDNSYLLIQMS